MKILVIEDDQGIVTTISLLFQISRTGAQVISTHLGEEGVKLVKREAPDVVILDLGLPDISGYDVLKRIRLFSAIPIIILSARAEKTDIAKGFELGANDYLVKPFRHSELLARVESQIIHYMPGRVKSTSI